MGLFFFPFYFFDTAYVITSLLLPLPICLAELLWALGEFCSGKIKVI